MAPKRKRRPSPPPKGLAPGELLKRFMLPKSGTTPWSWVGSEVTNADRITLEHRMAVYGFSPKSGLPSCKNKYEPTEESKAKSPAVQNPNDDIIVISDSEDVIAPCSKKACKCNPRCLNYLGQDLWEDEEKARALFDRATDLGDDPLLLSREPDIPAGLKNLGATCYANSSLQVWFRDIAFRNGVYQCQIPEGAEERFKESPIFQLQVTFAALQEGRQNVFNPTNLVESLQLRTSEQQDAQEFSKLFMSHLDAEFKKQSDPAVKGLIASQFQGSQVYGTICTSCQYTSERTADFLEIEVNFKGNSRLEDRIKASLEPETLSGENQYFCPQCNCLQDATRYTELRQLPPVLHFSLLRFVYDLATMERKKSKHVISFPTVLDMGQFLGKCDQSEEPTGNRKETELYQLRGILLHKGGSAYHGHYEAQVYDTQLASWYQFNDETVTKIASLGDKNRGNKATTDTTAEKEKRKNARKRRRIEDSEDEEAIAVKEASQRDPIENIASKDAYMLVYARKDLDTDSRVLTSLEPPPTALKVVQRVNEDHQKMCEDHEARVASMKAKFEERRQTVMRIYRSWRMDCGLGDAVVVSQQLLKDWLSKYCYHDIFSEESHDESARKPLERISNAEILCKHNKLDPTKANEMKLIPPWTCDSICFETFCEILPSPQPKAACEECVSLLFKERLYEIEHPRIVKEFEAVQEVQGNGAVSFWISKPWLKDWKLLKPRMHRLSEQDPAPNAPEFYGHVLCEHGGITPNQIHRKRISTQAKEILAVLYPIWDPPSSEVEVCAVCEALVSMSKEDKRELRRRAEEEKARLKHMNNMMFNFSSMPSSPSCAVIPTDFYKAWKRWIDNPTTQPRPESIDNSPFLCNHEMLLFDPNCSEDLDSIMTVIRRDEWDTLLDLYAGGPTIGLQRKVTEKLDDASYEPEVPVCLECQLKRKKDWDTAEIIIQLVRPGKENGAPLKNGAGTGSSSAVRHSKRLRQKQGDRQKIGVTKSTTVKEIKIKIAELFEIPTICQRLTLEGKELQHNEATVASLGILANDVLHLEQITEAMDLDSDSDSTAPGRAREEGRGFNGTVLGGGMTDSSRPSSRADTPDEPAIGKACKACTFANGIDALTCEICDTIF